MFQFPIFLCPICKILINHKLFCHLVSRTEVDLRLTSRTSNDHCQRTGCDCTMGISWLVEASSIWPLIVLIFRNDWSSRTCGWIVREPANDVNALFGWSCCIISNPWKKNKLKMSKSPVKMIFLPISIGSKWIVSCLVPLVRSIIKNFSFNIWWLVGARYKWLIFIPAQHIRTSMWVIWGWLYLKIISIKPKIVKSISTLQENNVNPYGLTYEWQTVMEKSEKHRRMPNEKVLQPP